LLGAVKSILDADFKFRKHGEHAIAWNFGLIGE
jgi:hypothetical protein